MPIPAIHTPYHVNYETNQSLRNLPDDEPVYYFAYGFNMASKQIDSRRTGTPKTMAEKGRWPAHWSQEIKPAEPIGRAILEGYRLNFDKISNLNPQNHYASVSPDASSSTEGVLWKLDKKFIEVLDFDEGVATQQYTRELVNVAVLTKDKTKQIYPALIYMAHPDASLKDGTQGKTTKRYQQALLNGAIEFGLSQKTIDLITNWPTVD